MCLWPAACDYGQQVEETSVQSYLMTKVRWYLKLSPQSGMRAPAPSSSHFNALPPASAMRIEKYFCTKALGKYENQPVCKSNPAVGTNPVQHDRSQRNDKLEAELNRL